MTDKELRRLSRMELTELLLEATEENEELKSENSKLRKRLEEKKVMIGECGSIAEASLRLSGIFEDAQRAADTYLENARRVYIEWTLGKAKKEYGSEDNLRDRAGKERGEEDGRQDEAEKKSTEEDVRTDKAGKECEANDERTDESKKKNEVKNGRTKKAVKGNGPGDKSQGEKASVDDEKQ